MKLLTIGVFSLGYVTASADLDPYLKELQHMGNLAWTTDVRPYERIIAEADVISGNLSLLRQRHLQAKRAFVERPIDPLLAFRWGTYFYTRMQKEQVPRADQERELMLSRIMRIPYVSNYPNARLRFLLESSSFATPVLVPWGDRLLARNPNDVFTLYAQSKNLGGAKELAEVRRGLVLAERYAKLRKNPGSGQVAVASAHYMIWLRTKERSEAEASIAAYRRYLEIGKPGADIQTRVARLIRKMGWEP